ncbi:hypothetical protein [Dermatophilus congolensis]|uniref:hypothetical protein n=1 Tax=Dermatophilus congolensis TaxID=1863 RepID=UPI001AAF9825|nr:hypothetical protein [Dermatophilus congolensis]MBO3142115.1 hypothetical protein [Dermatophilus congolensis]MBO3151107.1 hypothetical protein [Dermatophilus congolensis]MBO3161891.1 hypothetical protein [Dermatophilus congolensis]MBO3162390.1 hypothetical protein [Dermatophilus congolensis]MBO3175948.1 hypothetical protein [Dermatophilus congolensis]
MDSVIGLSATALVLALAACSAAEAPPAIEEKSEAMNIVTVKHSCPSCTTEEARKTSKTQHR